MDKADGSLGILYPVGDGWAISTRGSFVSEQAIHATRVLNEKYAHVLATDKATGIGGYSEFADYVREWTFLFEIIYPTNRIVLNYGKMDDLVLLGAVNKVTGHYIGPNPAAAMLIWDGPVVKTFDYNTLSDALGYMSRKNAEGYVVRSHNFLVKMKQADYLELHRLVTNLTPRTVWAQLAAGKSAEQIVSAFPDEFADQAQEYADELVSKHTKRLWDIQNGYLKIINNIDPNAKRKDFAQKFAKQRDASYYFQLLDGKEIDLVVWKELRPRASERDTDE